jgi:hypothetical protein
MIRAGDAAGNAGGVSLRGGKSGGGRAGDVHIDGGRIDFQEQAANGITSAHQGRVIALSQCKMESSIFDGALVDEEELFVA